MRVSIVIPAYNGQKWISAAVRSALGQQLIAGDGLPELYEVIVRDDGSSDCTWEELEKLQAEYPGKLRIVRGEHMPTLPQSFQAAFDLATTPYVTIIGQDDLLDTDYLASVLPEFEDENVAMVSCRPRFIDGDGKAYDNPQDMRCSIPKPACLPREELKASLRLGNMHFGLNTYRRRVHIDLGGFDPKTGWLLDWDMYLRILDKYEIKIIDRELCSLGLRMDCTSALKVEQLPEQHRYYNYVRRKAFPPSKTMKVAIATAFYMSQEYSHYGESLLYTCRMLTQAGIEWELLRVNGDSYVERAKNTLIANFLETDCTDLVMIDSDEQWHPAAIARLLHHPEEVVAGAYPFKNKWGSYAGNPLVKMVEGKPQYIGHELADGSCLLEAYNIAGGFLRIKRAAIERFQDHYWQDVYRDDCAWPGRDGRIYTQFFNCEVINHERYGEDANFSRKMATADIKLWIDPNITIVHYGIKGWEGNLHQHILKPPEELERIKREREAEAVRMIEANPLQAAA